MLIKIIAVGKVNNPQIALLIKDYETRLKHYINFKINYTKGVRLNPNASKKVIQKTEREQLLSHIQKGDFIIALDRRGHKCSSFEFAKLLDSKMNRGTKSVVFIIGGPLGFDQELLDKVDYPLSFSTMTFPHEISLLLLTEQIYRAMTILKGEKYHK